MNDTPVVSSDVATPASPQGEITGLVPTKLPGLVIDDRQAEGLTVVEWPDLAAPWLPDERLLVRLAHLSETKRTLRFYPTGDHYKQLVEQFKKESFGT